ncbi:S41 family peptidase [Desemzia sp. FAM 23991]|uniref:S41 family peptidase n=1 Tax=unclassified Desemzia TaxID=2685243 RepID=UPI00388513F9
MNNLKYRPTNYVKGKWLIFIFSILLFLTACQQKEASSQMEVAEEVPEKSQVIENEYAFSKLFGYIRFFHPSDEASQVNWNDFAVYGADEVLGATNNEELRETLEQLYLPIAPTAVFYNPSSEDIPSIDSPVSERIAWQHKGLGIEDLMPSIYNSERVHAKVDNDEQILSDNALFEEYPAENDVMNVQLTDELAVVVPLTLGIERIEGEAINNIALEDMRTIGSTEESRKAFSRLESELSLLSENLEDKHVQFAATTITWNNLQHFSPNSHVVDTKWEELLMPTLDETYEADSKEGYMNVLMSLLEKTGDGHANISDTRFPHTNSFVLEPGEIWPFQADVVNGEVIVTATDAESQLEEGDQLLTIGSTDVNSWIEEIQETIPGSSQLKEYRALQYIRELPGEKVTIERDGTEHTYTDVEKSRTSIDEFYREEPIKELEENIWYVNLNQPVLDELNENLTTLQAAEGIIFDLRGYPYSFAEAQEVIQLLTDEPLIGPIFRFHAAIYPDRESPILIDEPTGFEASERKLDSEIVFLSYSGSMSMPEYFLKYVKNNQLGTIIGEPTAGSDGNMYTYSIPGRLFGGITMVEVLNLDESQTHLVGVEPDIYVNRTREGVKKGEDEFISEAIEYIHSKRSIPKQ